MYTIYKLQSTVTDRVYIGCTSQTLHRRFISHISSFNKNNSDIQLYSELRKVDLNILDFTIHGIIEIENRSEAYKLEQEYIKKYRNTCGVFNFDFSENHWAKGTKGVCKVNSGSFKKGMAPNETSFKKGMNPWNKGGKGLQKGSCVGTITVHKDDKNKRIAPEELEAYILNGYKKGMKPRRQAKGYSVQKNGKFAPYITINGKLKHLGMCDTKEEAMEIRKKALDML